MKKQTSLSLFILFLLASAVAVNAGQTIYDSIIHDDIEREYILYVPDSYTGASQVPLILNFHGYTSNATEQMHYGDFRPIADTEGFLLVHPEGTLLNGKTHWNVGGWTSASTADDIGFTDALIDALASAYSIDLNRVYSTGMSNGGYFSFHLACHLSNRIAAIASVTGSMTPDTYDECNAQRPVPVMQIHGTADPVVPYGGDEWAKPIPDVLAYWVDFNNCDPNAQMTSIPDIEPGDGSTVELYVYPNGDQGVHVEHFKVINAMHTWPGSAWGGGGTNYDIDASYEIWLFFNQYDINGRVGDPPTPAPTATPQVTPTPTPGNPSDVTLDLVLSETIFNEGDPFILDSVVNVGTNPLDQHPHVVVMDVYGDYFWYPSWGEAMDYELRDFPTGETIINIFDFTWPQVDGSADGIRFYGAILDPAMTRILGEFDVVEFGWE